MTGAPAPRPMSLWRIQRAGCGQISITPNEVVVPRSPYLVLEVDLVGQDRGAYLAPGRSGSMRVICSQCLNRTLTRLAACS